MLALTDTLPRTRPIAASRILLGAGVLLIAVETAATSTRLASGDVLTMPVVFRIHATDVSTLGVFAISAIAGIGIALGVFTRWWALLVVLLELLTFLTDQQLYSNHRVLLTLLAAFLIFAKSDAAWAPGAKARARASLNEVGVPWWPQFLMLCAVSSCYLFAGLSKINPYWLRGTQLDEMRWLSLSSAQLHLLAVLTIATEVFIALALWWPRARVLAALAGIGLHTSIVLLLDSPLVFSAFALLCISTYPLFLNRPALRTHRPIAPLPQSR